MFNNSSKLMFIMILIMGTMISVSANSWISAWMGLEINLLSFIPLMSESNNLMSSEASMKYFLTQAMASIVLLFSIILLMMNYEFTSIKMNWILLIVFSSLLLKSGSAPFHFWFPNVMEGLSWMNVLILMTWQKIAPLMLMSYMKFNMLIISCIMLSSLIGSLGGLNQTSLRKLMAYSSINHIGWMLSAMYSSENLWTIYFSFYFFLSLVIITMFNLFNVYHLNQLFSLFIKSKIMKISMFLNLLSLGGLPPFLGFIPKWLVIQSLSVNNQFFLMTFITLTTLITLFFYLRLCFSAFMMNYYELQWNNQMNYNFNKKLTLLSLSFMSIFGLIIINLIY